MEVTMTFRANNPEPVSEVTVVPVAPSLSAVYDPRVRADIAVGHIDYENGRFHVGLEDEDMEPYSLDSRDRAVEWFSEFTFALTLGSAQPAAETAAARHSRAA
jgi:hypothetical protein